MRRGYWTFFFALSAISVRSLLSSQKSNELTKNDKDLLFQLEGARREKKEVQFEMEKVTRGLREATERIQLLDRENVSLKEDGKDLQRQIESGCKALQEAERDLRRAEGDKNELTLALDEAEAALEQVHS